MIDGALTREARRPEQDTDTLTTAEGTGRRTCTPRAGAVGYMPAVQADPRWAALAVYSRAVATRA